jgi:hypothetical protein
LSKIYTVLSGVLVPGHVGLFSLEGGFGREELLFSLAEEGVEEESLAVLLAEGEFDRGKIWRGTASL